MSCNIVQAQMKAEYIGTR